MERDEPTIVHAFTGPPPGTVLLNKYRVDWTLGMGGFGLVLRAQHLTLDEPVAIKILRDDKDADRDTIERFMREAQAVVQLKSAHAIKIWDVGRLDTGSPYIVMELLDGMDLGKLLEVRTRLPLTLAVDYVLQACEALAEAHSLGIVHRDVKPTNLYVARQVDGSEILKVLDFGISKSLANSEQLSLTQTATLLGTPMYMSPEQLRSARSVDARSDLWSIGCVLYELVEGSLPFPAENYAELCVLVTTEEPPPMSFGQALEPVILRCLAKDPDARYRSIAELAVDLSQFASPHIAATCVPQIQRLLQATALPAARVGPPRAKAIAIPRGSGSAFDVDETLRRAPPKRSRAMVFALVAVIALAAVVSIGFALRGSRATDPVAMPVQTPPPAAVVATDPPPVAAGSPGAAGSAAPLATGSAAPTPPPVAAGSAAPTPPPVAAGSAATPTAAGSAVPKVPHRPPVVVKAPPPVVVVPCDPLKDQFACAKRKPR